MQRFSIFHSSSEEFLKAWHRPYADLFTDCTPVLDFGCGPGYFADLLKARGVECVGLDIDPEMVTASEARGHVAHQGNQQSLNQLGVKFGGIHISHVIEHLWGEEVVGLFEQCAASLRDGGILVIRTPNWAVADVRHKVFWTDHTHRRPYVIDAITKILVDMGFHIETAGSEPYGLQDLFVVAVKGNRSGSELRLDFSRSPYPPVPLARKLARLVPSRLRAKLRSLRGSSDGG